MKPNPKTQAVLAVLSVLLFLGSALPVLPAASAGQTTVGGNSCFGKMFSNEVTGLIPDAGAGGDTGDVPLGGGGSHGPVQGGPQTFLSGGSAGGAVNAEVGGGCAGASATARYPDTYWQRDSNNDRMGDEWTKTFEDASGQTITTTVDAPQKSGLAKTTSLRYQEALE